MVQKRIDLKEEYPKEGNFRDRVKSVMSGISGAFVFPIATLAILAFFLSVGGFLEGLSNPPSKAIGSFLKQFSFPLLKALPILFCVAFAASFCKDDVVCVWGSLIAYFVFIGVQNAFIHEDSGNYTVLFSGYGRDSNRHLVDKMLGFKTLNTSILGSFLVGGVIMPHVQKKWSNVNLPGPFAFFSGKRFIPLISSLMGGVLALLFLLFWPWIGRGMGIAGNAISRFSKASWGVDSLIFGFLEKSLIPFGLHHAFYAPLWYTQVGGDATKILADISVSGTGEAFNVLNALKDGTAAGSKSMWMGDSFLGMSAISLPANEIVSGQSVMDYFDNNGLKIGRFTQGKYPIMQFALPAAALAMIFAAPKENRKDAFKKLAPGMASCFFMGITEPIEFTFLFMAPKLFYGFHAVCCGLSFMAMNKLGAHVPSIFSGGFIEMILLGIIPMMKGTQFYWYLAVGGVLGPLYFLVFSIAIRKLNLATPGRESLDGIYGESESHSNSKVPANVRKLALALGGWDNVSKYSNCASRLRYDIVDRSKVSEEGLKAAGIIAVKFVGDNHVQLIVGPKAESINNEMLQWKGEPL